MISMPAVHGFNQRLSQLSDDKQKELKTLKETCSEFESIFMHHMLKEMRNTVDKSGLIDGGQAEQIFSDMLDQERAKEMSIGIGDLLFQDLARAYLPPIRTSNLLNPGSDQ